MNPVCTSLPCQWLEPHMADVECAPIVDIDFSNQVGHGDVSRKQEKPTKKVVRYEEPTKSELDNFYSALAASDVECSVLSLIPQHCDAYAPTMPDDAPSLLTSLFDEAMLGATFGSLLEHCESLFHKLSVTPEEVQLVERLTRAQSNASSWFDYRGGRVTASRFKQAARTSPSNPSVSLIKAICYPEAFKFTSQATRWGCKHEDTARKEYISRQKAKHYNLEVKESGLFLSCKYPHIGASPDGLVTCKCCGKGLLEVKCPFNCRYSSIADVAEHPKFCLKRLPESDSLELKRDHAYFYQVQTQLAVCEAAYCDFVIWNDTSLFTQRLEPDEPFIDEAIEAVTTFYKVGVMPELVGKWYSKNFSALPADATPATLPDVNVTCSMSTPSTSSCYCNGEKDGQAAKCANESCARKFFHLVCLKIKHKPGKHWLCPECRKARRQRKE